MKKLTFSIFFAVLAISCLTAEVRIRADVGGSVQIGNRNALKEGIDVRLGADIPVWNGLEIPVYVSAAFGNIARESVTHKWFSPDIQAGIQYNIEISDKIFLRPFVMGGFQYTFVKIEEYPEIKNRSFCASGGLTFAWLMGNNWEFCMTALYRYSETFCPVNVLLGASYRL